jgi:hypothetical protein
MLFEAYQSQVGQDAVAHHPPLPTPGDGYLLLDQMTVRETQKDFARAIPALLTAEATGDG